MRHSKSSITRINVTEDSCYLTMLLRMLIVHSVCCYGTLSLMESR